MKKQRQKWVCFLAVLTLVLAVLCACGTQPEQEEEPAPVQETEPKVGTVIFYHRLFSHHAAKATGSNQQQLFFRHSGCPSVHSEHTRWSESFSQYLPHPDEWCCGWCMTHQPSYVLHHEP